MDTDMNMVPDLVWEKHKSIDMDKDIDTPIG